jgi:hypothetical protein
MTSIFQKMEDDLNLEEMEDNLSYQLIPNILLYFDMLILNSQSKKVATQPIST